MSHPGGNVGVHPVLVLLVFPVHEPDQDRDKCREVEEGSAGSEPELLIRDPVDVDLERSLTLTTINQLTPSLLRGSARQR